MSTDKAAEIIKQAMADRGVYEEMAARENEIWGKILVDREQSGVVIDEIKAGNTLGIFRNQASLHHVASERGLKFEHALTLGCGTGRCERDLILRAFAPVSMGSTCPKTR